MTALLTHEQWKNIAATQRENCAVCGNSLGKAVVTLPDFPLTEIYVEVPAMDRCGTADQELCFCEFCGHGQLRHILDPHSLYGDAYFTRTSQSASAMQAADVFLQFVARQLEGRAPKTILEFGCNDLYLLQKLKPFAEKLYGVDPVLKQGMRDPSDGKIEIIPEYFENLDWKATKLAPDVVLSSHTLEHIAEPAALLEKLFLNCGPETLFVFQFPGFEMLLQQSRFDQVFHQHLQYFSESSLHYWIESQGGAILEIVTNPLHWGAQMVAFRKKSKAPNEKKAPIQKIKSSDILRQYEIFQENMHLTRKRLQSFSGERILGYGAALMLPVLDYHLGGLEMLEAVIDDDPKKQQKFYLQFPLPIISREAAGNLEDAVVLLTAVQSLTAARKILSLLTSLNPKQIVLPLNVI